MATEIQILQILRLKGRATLQDVAWAADITRESAETTLQRLVDTGHCEALTGHLKVTKRGRSLLESLLDEERAHIDTSVVEKLYEEFDGFNVEFKNLVTEWQMKSAGLPNDHTDPGYDQHVIEILTALHHRFMPYVERITRVAPRLNSYATRFTAALARLRAGDHAFLARPLIDSYHTVWFELHQDLIGLAGRTRLAEAQRGRAQ